MEKEQVLDYHRVGSHKRLPVWEGLVAWLLIAQFIWPDSLLALPVVHLLLMLAPLVVVPLGLRLSGLWDTVLHPLRWFLFPSALLPGLSYCLPGLSWTAWCTLPWLLWTTVAAVLVLRHHISSEPRRSTLASFIRLCGFLYLPVGAAWTLADRLGIQPLGFTDPIVLLTATHFHFAGFILPVVASYLLTRERTLVHRVVAWGIVLGVPLVAAGILFTHVGGPRWVESLFATLMALAGLGLAFWQMGYSLQRARWASVAPLAGSILLMGGMILALLYANRTLMAMEWLSIPWMYALHGSINTLACLLLAWQPTMEHEQEMPSGKTPSAAKI